MATMYEITEDLKTLERWMGGFEDPETGEVRPLTEEDKEAMAELVGETADRFETKFDNICKYRKNLLAEAQVASAARDAFKGEMDGLQKRAKATEAKADRMKDLLMFAMDRLRLPKIKTALFSAGYQNTRKTVKESPTFPLHVDTIPKRWLKRELDKTAINDAIEKGDIEILNDELGLPALYYQDGFLKRKLQGVEYSGGRCLVVR